MVVCCRLGVDQPSRNGSAIDLRLICTDRDDYAPSSPIEPSAVGGGKITRAVSRAVTGS